MIIDVSKECNNNKQIVIGHRGENGATIIQFDFSAWRSEFGDGSLGLAARLPRQVEPYVVALETDGTISSWTVSSYDTQINGQGAAQVVYIVDGVVKKSQIYRTYILDSIEGSVPTPPDPYETYIEQMMEIAADTYLNAQAAAESATNASESASDASGSAQAAAGYADNASESAGAASASASDAISAKDEAVSAASAATSAKTYAESAASTATSAKTAAAESAAEAAQSASVFVIDPTLTHSGQAADAKVVGDELTVLKSELLEPTRNINTSNVGYYLTNNSGVISAANNKYFGLANKVACLPSTTYTISFNDYVDVTTPSTYVSYYASDDTFISKNNVGRTSYKAVTITTPANAYYMHVYFYKNEEITLSTGAGIQIEVGSTKTEYVPPYGIKVPAEIKENIADNLLKGDFGTYNLFDGSNYTEIPLLYLNANNGKVTSSQSSPFITRTISVKITGGKFYRIWKNTVSVIRVTSGSIETPNAGQAASVFVANNTASNDPITIQTVPADNYLYIQLFADTDDASVRSVDANISTLVIIEEPVNPQEDIPFLNDIIEKNHRGYQTVAPENTIPAFKLSRQLGYRWIETDVRFTSDNVAVLMHDESINRTARNADGTELSSTVNIADITYEDALTYDYGIWKSAYYAGTKIPTLAQALDLCKKIGLSMCLELKVGSQTQIEAIKELVYAYGMEDNFEYLCSNKTIFETATTNLQSCDIGLVGSDLYTDNTLLTFMQSCEGNSNTLFYHSYAYTSDSTRRAIIDSLHSNGFELVIRGNTETDITGAPTYTKRFITNALHPAKVLYDSAMADTYTT